MSLAFKLKRRKIILSGAPCKNRPKKKVDFRFYFFFFIFMKDQVKKSLSLVGKKIKSLRVFYCLKVKINFKRVIEKKNFLRV